MDIIPGGIQKYAEEFTSEEPDVLASLNRETNTSFLFPRMLSGHLQGRFLSMISTLIKPRQILEIGTYTGYSAICLAEGLQEGGRLHTIELNDENEVKIREYFNKAGVESKIKLYFGNALDIIPAMDVRFDLVFLDADKENYVNYYEQIFDKVRPGGLILADNTLWSGKVLESSQADKETEGIKEFNRTVTQDIRVENVLLTIRDGIMMIRKK
jgi:predicted O-methyltransferase YrrM